ncbi:MAG: protein translocase SEC61 complex subunit gamma [archaeon]|nr:MAG: protein translocase SEC61 complex subunit gamma [archaeon]
MGKFKQFFQQCGRVFRVSRKPTGEEIKQVSKISALGILIIGMIGFIITMVFTLMF